MDVWIQIRSMEQLYSLSISSYPFTSEYKSYVYTCRVVFSMGLGRHIREYIKYFYASSLCFNVIVLTLLWSLKMIGVQEERLCQVGASYGPWAEYKKLYTYIILCSIDTIYIFIFPKLLTIKSLSVNLHVLNAPKAFLLCIKKRNEIISFDFSSQKKENVKSLVI